jgi:hypothetical protein
VRTYRAGLSARLLTILIIIRGLLTTWGSSFYTTDTRLIPPIRNFDIFNCQSYLIGGICIYVRLTGSSAGCQNRGICQYHKWMPTYPIVKKNRTSSISTISSPMIRHWSFGGSGCFLLSKTTTVSRMEMPNAVYISSLFMCLFISIEIISIAYTRPLSVLP